MKLPRNKVAVYCRLRPSQRFANDVIHLLSDKKTINIHQQRDERQGLVNNQIVDWSFKTDGFFHNVSQDEIYTAITAPLISQAMDGINATVMCYGQTGSGKTFTMTGTTQTYHHRGILPRAISQIFNKEVPERQDKSINVKVSYFQIYNEQITDLLGELEDSQAVIPTGQVPTVVEDENGVYVKGLSYHLVQSEEDALNLLFEGEENREIGAHILNRKSSRSHCVFSIFIECRSRVSSDSRYTYSKLNFVDLAGSERLSKTHSAGRVKEEAMYINKSLTFLEQTVVALAEKNRDHVPYRQSKLTHFLKDSIGGNCSTILLANVWGEAAHIEETVSTLRLAQRMMKIQAEPCVNEKDDPVVHVRKLENEIRVLRQELSMHDTLTNRTMISYEPISDQQRAEIEKHVRKYLDESLDDLDIVNIRQIKATFEAFRSVYKAIEKDVATKIQADSNQDGTDKTGKARLPTITSAESVETKTSTSSADLTARKRAIRYVVCFVVFL